jgi:hypothetical protein
MLSVLLLASSLRADQLGTLIDNLNDPSLRNRAAEQMAKLKDPRAIQPLIMTVELLQNKTPDKTPDFSYKAAEVLARIGSQSVKPLSDVLADSTKSRKVRFFAIDALTRIGEPAIETLFDSLNDSDEKIRFSAGESLTMLGEPVLEPWMIKMEEEGGTYYNVRGMVQKSVTKVNRRVFDRLLKEAAAKNIPVVAGAYKLFIAAGEQGTEGILVEMLNSSYGSKEVAEDFLNSGNDSLVAAAHVWASRHGYTVGRGFPSGVGGTWRRAK